MRTLGNILWFIFRGMFGGLAWILQDASGVLRLLEFRLDGSFSRWQGFRLCHLARV